MAEGRTTGVPVAWSEVYAELAPDLIRFATFLVGPTEAEDVVSDAMISVLRRPPAGGITRPNAYLYRTVANTARNRLRATSRRVGYEQRSSHSTQSAEPPEIRPEVAAAVAALSPQQREAIYLAYWVDLTPAQVADHLGVSEGTVRRQLARARRRLKGVLDV
jgi:RNA polymerase sigma factor (sigma-70 family)